MKAFLLLGLVLLVAISGYGGAQLRVDQAVYDFGEVTEGYVVNCTFLIANVGDAPAKFTYPPITSCGCTTAPLPKQELAPGESMELPVLFDSSGYGGKEVTETVTLYVEGESPLRLVLQGYVRPAEEHQRPASALFYSYYILVDVRPPEAFARGHLLGAVNIPLGELPELMSRLPEGTRAVPIFIYDENGEGASRAARALVDARAGGRPMGVFSGWARSRYIFVLWKRVGKRFPRSGWPGITCSLLDLRPAEEFAQGHLPGAVNLAPEDLPGWVWSLPRPKDLPAGAGFTVWCLDEDGTVASQVAGSLRAVGLRVRSLPAVIERPNLYYHLSELQKAGIIDQVQRRGGGAPRWSRFGGCGRFGLPLDLSCDEMWGILMINLSGREGNSWLS